MTGKRSDPADLLRQLTPSGVNPAIAMPSSGSSSGSSSSGPSETTSSGATSSAAAGDPASRDSCGEFDIRIAPDGTWFYHGSPITRKPLVKLFASVLKRRADGEYWLETPAEKGRIRVDDAPFLAVELTATGSGRAQELVFRTNIDEFVTAGPEHHIRVTVETATAEPRPYIMVRDGLEALIARPVFYQLVDLSEENGPIGERQGGEVQYGVWSRGTFFPLGQTDRT